MSTAINRSFRHDLGAGLVLRWSTAADIERIATFHGLVHRERADEPPNLNYMNSVRALMSGDNPLMGPDDFGIVEDTSKEGTPVIACACWWRHTWTYEGISFGVGRPELVATDPAYRNRGLIRTLFEMLHARSVADGDMVQAITGISYFYRQFGYEYALELEDRRATPLALIPEAKLGEPEPIALREATASDIPELIELYKQRQESGIVAESPTYEQWLYEIETWKRHPELGHTINFQMIVDDKGETVGMIAFDAKRRGNPTDLWYVWLLELREGVNKLKVMPSILRALRTYALSLKPARSDYPPLQEICFALGTIHPVHEILGEALDYPKEPPYAWYLRVKDLPAFLMHIAPALEARLAASPVAGYTGDLKLNFYRGGLRMIFERGHLTGVENWRVPLHNSDESAAFPPLTFLPVLFGHRSIEALRQIFPDVWVSNEARIVLKALFPTRPSFVFGWN
ncbi:GNAT family N-acetyltransferase [Ktedonospora formicarum]|uniref:N-acetyltransferase domain-containing protein n=1 Tax=Ktedonospora formicarum TaxID=2778364 RepID=A0A8J3MSN8_9CHLR|nr:GNAT family N-acetyltransferase [Ktedonospora formicarum]GHO46315.1 hypothetical protein KSX_44780 [Ktedonospora formicarum]